MPVSWPDEVDEILGGDLAVGLAYATPAKGVVITPMAPLGVRDRELGTVTLSSSLGLPKKLVRIRANPRVAVAYHARDHSGLDRSEFVLVQGTARFGKPDRAWLDSIKPQWERFLGPLHTGLLGRWLRVYYYERVAIVIEVERICVWPDATCAGEPVVHGAPVPSPEVPSQRPPKNGTGARVATAAIARHAERLPHTLLGWVGGDGFPQVIGARVAGSDDQAIAIEPVPAIPQGARRAGLTSHAFEPRMVGQEQRIHTGWLERDGDRVRYSPHTKAGYRLPASKPLFVAGSAIATRRGIRKARAAGLT